MKFVRMQIKSKNNCIFAKKRIVTKERSEIDQNIKQMFKYESKAKIHILAIIHTASPISLSSPPPPTNAHIKWEKQYIFFFSKERNFNQLSSQRVLICPTNRTHFLCLPFFPFLSISLSLCLYCSQSKRSQEIQKKSQRKLSAIFIKGKLSNGNGNGNSTKYRHITKEMPGQQQNSNG